MPHPPTPRAGVATARRVGVGLLALALLPALPGPGAAQACGDPPAPPARHVESIQPRSGPPGTSVRVEDLQLPVYATVHLAIGQVGGGGYQVSDALETDAEGRLEGSIAVPDWAESDRAVFVMVFSEDYQPIAFSDPFHVTDAQGRFRRSGTVVSLDGGCLGLEGDDATYALVGEGADGLGSAVGEPITVEARLGEPACGCRDALEVLRVLDGGE